MKKKYAGLVFGGLAAGLLVVYLGFSLFFMNHFCFGTVIDGISVGGRSAAAVESLIKQEIDSYSLKLIGREGTEETIFGNSINIQPVFHGEVKALLEEQNGFLWPKILFQKEKIELKKVVSYDEEALKEVISELPVMQSANQRKPVNASYAPYMEGRGYTLIEADYGTTIEQAVLSRAVKEAVEVLDETLDMEENGCYVDPDVADDNEKLLALIDTMNSYAGTTITYQFGEEEEVLDGETISTWLSDEDLDLVVDEEAVLAYVKTLAREHNTAYGTKTLKTTYGETVKISGGHYGWRIDNEAEKTQILEDLKTGGGIKREPLYIQTANSHGENDYGDSYVEINLTAQHLFLYKDGKLVIETDFVSGNVANGYASPTGAFALTYKTRNAVLRGDDYETPVDYWMPFAGDVGMHDADWRNRFGGTIYKKNGSHGCINLPPAAAKTIYETIDQGYAVLVYELAGTESKEAQKQEAAEVTNAISKIGTVTLESENAIVYARELYRMLSDEARSYVTNYQVLTAAEAALEQLKAGVPTEEVQQPAEEQPAEQVQQPAEEQPAEQVQQPAEEQPAEQVQQPAEEQPAEQVQ